MARRISFNEPAGGLTPQVVSDMLMLAGAVVYPVSVERWTELERLLAYDWAVRVHLRASDVPVRRRPRPSFIPGRSDG